MSVAPLKARNSKKRQAGKLNGRDKEGCQLLSQIRRATIDDQQAVLNWLLKKFNLNVEK